MSESEGGERRIPIIPTNVDGGRTVVNYRAGTSYELVGADEHERRTQPSQERHHRRPIHRPDQRVVPEGRERRAPRLPTAMEFRMRLARMRKAEQHEPLPPVPENPTASDVAHYARFDTGKIDGMKDKVHPNGTPQGFTAYLHEIARRMVSQREYHLLGKIGAGKGEVSDGPKIPPIQLRADWRTGWDGSHRMLVLKLLGPEFVEKSGMNEWVKINGPKL